MQLWDFEPWLVAALAEHPGIVEVATFAQADVPASYGIVLRSTSGATVLVHLTRGSGGHDRRVIPAEHDANVARVGDRRFEPKPLDDAVAERVEGLLRRLLDTGQPPGFSLAMTLHDRRAMQESAKRTRTQPKGRTPAGLVVVFEDKAEIYIYLYG